MRLFNRPLAFILAVALAVAAAFVVIDVIALAVGADPVGPDWGVWYRWARHTTWNARVVVVVSIIMLVIGVVLLLAELKPPRSKRVKLVSPHQATDAAMTRKGLAGAARAAALDVDGISTANAHAKGRKVQVNATSAARDPGVATQLRDSVEHAVQTTLDNLELAHKPRLKVAVTAKKA